MKASFVSSETNDSIKIKYINDDTLVEDDDFNLMTCDKKLEYITDKLFTYYVDEIIEHCQSDGYDNVVFNKIYINSLSHFISNILMRNIKTWVYGA
jgi:hypothetical protein